MCASNGKRQEPLQNDSDLSRVYILRFANRARRGGCAVSVMKQRRKSNSMHLSGLEQDGSYALTGVAKRACVTTWSRKFAAGAKSLRPNRSSIRSGNGWQATLQDVVKGVRPESPGIGCADRAHKEPGVKQ